MWSPSTTLLAGNTCRCGHINFMSICSTCRLCAGRLNNNNNNNNDNNNNRYMRFILSHPIAVETGPVFQLQMSRLVICYAMSADALPCALVITARVPFCFSKFQLSCSSLILCCCMTVFVLRTSRTDVHSRST